MRRGLQTARSSAKGREGASRWQSGRGGWMGCARQGHNKGGTAQQPVRALPQQLCLAPSWSPNHTRRAPPHPRADEELARVGVGPRVGHAKRALLVARALQVLVCELPALAVPHRELPGAVVVDDVAALGPAGAGVHGRGAARERDVRSPGHGRHRQGVAGGSAQPACAVLDCHARRRRAATPLNPTPNSLPPTTTPTTTPTYTHTHT